MDPIDKSRRRAIRREKLNKDCPDDTTLSAFVVDYFPEIARRFSSGMDCEDKRNLLLRYADESLLDQALGLSFAAILPSLSSDGLRGQIAEESGTAQSLRESGPVSMSRNQAIRMTSWGRVVPRSVMIITLVVSAACFGGVGFLWGRTSAHAPPGMIQIQLGFWLRLFVDLNLVTVADYEICVRAGVCTPANTTHYLDQQDQATSTIYNTLCTAALPDRANHPINCVDYDQAKTYCEFVGKRLPSVTEWEKAAGPDKYPWGNEPPTPERVNACDRRCVEWARKLGHRWRIQPNTRANVELVPWLGVPSEFLFDGDDGYETTAPVGSKPANVYGLRDMVGSLRQWTTDETVKVTKDGRSIPMHILKGGSWNELRPDHLSIPFRFQAPPDVRSEMHGFRCVTNHPLPLPDQIKPRSIEP